jgi:hypothetical protein
MPKQVVIGEIRGQRPSLIVEHGVDVAEGEVPLTVGQWIQESLKVSIATNAIVSMVWFKGQLYRVLVVYFYGVGKPVEQHKALPGHRLAEWDFLQVVD